MSVNKRRFSAAEKLKVAIDAIKMERTIAEISSVHGVHSTQISKWKKQALEYLQAGFANRLELSTDYYEKRLAELYQQIGRLKVENDFLKKNVIYLKNDRRDLLEPNHSELSIRQQCEILGINRSSYYYQPMPIDEETLALMRLVDEVYTEYPFFGTRQMVSYLVNQGYTIGRTRMRGIYKRLGLQAVCPGPHTSKPHPEHKVYPYLLRDVEIIERDQVWSTDITYLRLRRGFVYLMAIIDWFSRYVLDWELSINLESDFCIEALARVLRTGKCAIFNTDRVLTAKSSIYSNNNSPLARNRHF